LTNCVADIDALMNCLRNLVISNRKKVMNEDLKISEFSTEFVPETRKYTRRKDGNLLTQLEPEEWFTLSTGLS